MSGCPTLCFKAGLITSRMCYSCHYYENHKDGFHCHLMKVDLPSSALRLDCPEHQQKNESGAINDSAHVKPELCMTDS